MSTAPFRLRLPPGTEQVARLLDAIEEYAEAASLPTVQAMRLALLAEELAVNVGDHGVGASFFDFQAIPRPEGIWIDFQDDGPDFDPLAAASPKTDAAIEARQVGGLGLHLVRSMTREARHERVDGRNRLRCLLPP